MDHRRESGRQPVRSAGAWARLAHWLAQLDSPKVVLVPGGGATADVVRAWDRQHRLGEETAHWLALRSMTFNAHFLKAILPGAGVVKAFDDWRCSLAGRSCRDSRCLCLRSRE